jgi:hypothetical protein
VPQGRKNNTDINRILSGFTVTSRKDVCTGFDMSIKKLRHIEKNDEEGVWLWPGRWVDRFFIPKFDKFKRIYSFEF